MDSKACVRIGNQVSEWFSENVGVRQGCVMSPWMFNLYIDGVITEVPARTMGRGAQLVGDGEEKWEVSQLLFADNTVLVADSKKKLERFVEEFGRVFNRMKFRVDVAMSKVMRSARDGIVGEMNIMMDGLVLEEVEVFKSLGSLVKAVRGVEADVQQRVFEGSWGRTMCRR